MRRLKIALGDLSYINEANRTNPNKGWANNLYVPLNVGFLASYAKKKFGKEVEIEIFKEPRALLRHAREGRPDVVGLASYYWNQALNDHVVSLLRRDVPGSLIVAGGPSIDSDPTEKEAFRIRHGVDIAIPNEGEAGFASVIESRLGGSEIKIPLGLSTDLADVPSPYLDGTLDPFLHGVYQPMVQTSRLCPYTCLAGDTPVNTIYGDIPIRELAERYGDAGVPVYTFDPETRDAFIADSVRIRKYGRNKQLVRVRFDDGTHIDCTPDHRFLRIWHGRQWECEAADLPVGTSVRAMRVEINPRSNRAYVTWARRDRRLRSRMVKEYEVGRRLLRTEHVHHRDHDTLNDVPDNLELCASAADHIGGRHPEIAERMRTNNPTKNGMSQEWRDNLAAANQGKVRSLESRLRYRESKLGAKNPNFKGGETAGRRSRVAEVNHRVVSVEWLAEKGDVYCLTVPPTGWFFANNVLVSNCAFCVSGKSRGKLRAFPLDQVFEEIVYIAERYTDRLDHVFHIVDENFGILERDVQIADFIRKTADRFGYPPKLHFYNDKRFTATSRAVHEALGDMVHLGVCLSLQSENPDTLKAIKRRNLTDEQITSGISWAHGLGKKVSTELIFGLPMETRQSFLAMLDKCARLNFDQMLCYHLIIFDGIEMNRAAYRQEHKLETRRRLMHGNAQRVEGKLCVENEEVVISSNTFGIEEYRFFRAMNVWFHAIFVNGLHKQFFKDMAARGESLTAFLSRLLEPHYDDGKWEWATAEHREWLSELYTAIDGELYTDEQMDALIADADAGRRELPTEIKLQPIFARKLSDNEHGWVKQMLSHVVQGERVAA